MLVSFPSLCKICKRNSVRERKLTNSEVSVCGWMTALPMRTKRIKAPGACHRAKLAASEWWGGKDRHFLPLGATTYSFNHYPAVIIYGLTRNALMRLEPPGYNQSLKVHNIRPLETILDPKHDTSSVTASSVTALSVTASSCQSSFAKPLPNGALKHCEMHITKEQKTGVEGFFTFLFGSHTLTKPLYLIIIMMIL